jgi:hypothetical protein
MVKQLLLQLFSNSSLASALVYVFINESSITNEKHMLGNLTYFLFYDGRQLQNAQL